LNIDFANLDGRTVRLGQLDGSAWLDYETCKERPVFVVAGDSADGLIGRTDATCIGDVSPNSEKSSGLRKHSWEWNLTLKQCGQAVLPLWDTGNRSSMVITCSGWSPKGRSAVQQTTVQRWHRISRWRSTMDRQSWALKLQANFTHEDPHPLLTDSFII